MARRNVVLMEDLKEAEQCACLAGEIIDDIARPWEIDGHSIRVGASMGMAFYPEDGNSAQELMKHAEHCGLACTPTLNHTGELKAIFCSTSR